MTSFFNILKNDPTSITLGSALNHLAEGITDKIQTFCKPEAHITNLYELDFETKYNNGEIEKWQKELMEFFILLKEEISNEILKPVSNQEGQLFFEIHISPEKWFNFLSRYRSDFGNWTGKNSKEINNFLERMQQDIWKANPHSDFSSPSDKEKDTSAIKAFSKRRGKQSSPIKPKVQEKAKELNQQYPALTASELSRHQEILNILAPGIDNSRAKDFTDEKYKTHYKRKPKTIAGWISEVIPTQD